MRLVHLALTNFRNFTSLQTEIPPGSTLLVGANAQGKTSFLEAIYYLVGAWSPHTANDRQLIQLGTQPPIGRLVAQIEHEGRTERIEIRLILEPAANGEGRLRKEVLLNGVKKRATDLHGRFNAVLFLPQDVELVARYADIFQIGARNMQNFILLDEVGKTRKPVMLKRGMSATIQEWLLSAEYILSQGNRQVMLCERGIRTFESYTRNTFDVSAIPIIKKLSHLPIIADPSHGTGKWYLVTPMALAAVAAGADGLMIEVHPDPAHALSDGGQSLKSKRFEALMEGLEKFAAAAGRTL